MSKIKDAALEEARLKDKEFFETNEPPKYKFLDEDGEHLHTYESQPLIGTSAVSNVLSKPLTYWASGLACAKFGWTHKGDKKKGWARKEDRLRVAIEVRTKITGLNDEQYLALLDEAYSAHASTLKTAAGKGTDLHAMLETWVKKCISENAGVPLLPVSTPEWEYTLILPFINWSVTYVKRFLVSEGHCYSTRLWVGGIVDLVYEKYDGSIGIMDFKSSKEAYLSQFWQCAGYDIQISENGVYDKNGKLLLKLDKPISEYAVFPFGMPVPTPQFNVDIAGGRAAFEAELLLYKKLN